MNEIGYEERKAVYETALKTWGANAQVMMVFEEVAELQKELAELQKKLCKHARGKDNLEEIAEEIADVTIMLEQLRLIFNVNEKVCEYMDQKILRLQKRLEN